MISSGTTIARAAEGCRKAGARSVYAAASHGVFAAAAGETLAASPVERIVVTDTIAKPVDERLEPKLVRLSVAPLFAAAIRRLHDGGSIVELLA